MHDFLKHFSILSIGLLKNDQLKSSFKLPSPVDLYCKHKLSYVLFDKFEDPLRAIDNRSALYDISSNLWNCLIFYPFFAGIEFKSYKNRKCNFGSQSCNSSIRVSRIWTQIRGKDCNALLAIFSLFYYLFCIRHSANIRKTQKQILNRRLHQRKP